MFQATSAGRVISASLELVLSSLGFDMQPLSRVVNTKNFSLGSTAHFDKHPDIAILATKVVAAAATVDGAFARMFVQLLHAEPRAAASMYLSVQADTTREAMLTAAAEAVLTTDEKELFIALRAVARSSLKLRHKVAHWVWGWSPDVPDALLICDPKEYVPLKAAHLEFDREFNAAKSNDEVITLLGNVPKLSRDKIFVVRAADLERGLRAIARTQALCLEFDVLLHVRVGDPSANAKRYIQLCSEPEIATELARLRKPKAGQSEPQE